MEAGIKKYREVSPERAKVWTKKSPKYPQNRKVPVIYYLCRNRQLEHPHFMEVPLSSQDGLYLRDVVDRLNTLRGRGMASVYSWSRKRSYKNGFVWHDLCEDDLILPAHGNEYVLKGSELFDESNSDHFGPISNVKTQSVKLLPAPSSSRSHDEASSSSSSMNGKDTRHSQENEFSEEPHGGSSDVSPESTTGKSDPLSLALTEYKIYKTDGLANASTQTEENVSRSKTQKTCTRGVSTEDGSLEAECHAICQARVGQLNDNPQIFRNIGSPLPSTSSPSSFGGKPETLESLLRADAGKMNTFRIVEEGIRMPTNTRLKASNLLMQLISCGSISVKNHSFGLIPNYKPSFSHSKFPSPLFSTSLMLGKFDCLSENPKLMSLRLEDREYFSGSLVETKLKEGDGHNVLKRSSSFNEETERTYKELKPPEDKEESSSGHSKCIPRSIKVSLSKQARNESMRSPISDGPRNSSDRIDGTSVSPVTSNGSSKRIIEPSLGEKQSKRVDSFREEGVIKIEERLASGARVIIQCKPFCEIASSSS
ncbi:PREDICTED: protein UPSTREAM OF FLC-like isoform X2 [Lupinus angustifolius]|uniref:protein UPSTREAM OF FLC-like isoform X2 n=1 Tax=Lupinus angustifolius TaxID=3871 RepID=UPI00092E5CAE|nr:PREDICTED: protein UPSTREAM OF FLC-like isoform X2 [Lupinus angustifolius]